MGEHHTFTYDVLSSFTQLSQIKICRMIPSEESPSNFKQEERHVVTEPERGKDGRNEIRKARTSVSTYRSPKRCASLRSLSSRRRCRSQSELHVNQRLNGCIPLPGTRHNEIEQSTSTAASSDNPTNSV